MTRKDLTSGNSTVDASTFQTAIIAPGANRLVLLCYYLFYPAHEQPDDDAGCANIEARELGCHAGDWQCIAIMLNATGDFSNAKPMFFGCTGVRPAAVDSVFRPYEFDPEKLTVMKVEEWRPTVGPAANLPELAGDHPRLFVALGSHSIYTTPGSKRADRYAEDREPALCGRFDKQDLAPPPPSSQGLGSAILEGIGVDLAKIIGGGLLGGPWGLIAGIILAAIETASEPDTPVGSGVTLTVNQQDNAPAAPGAGRTVRPKGLTLSDGGNDVVDWKAQQALTIGGRRYDFLVDRANQVWWPSDDGRSGYRGRWGQRVTSDILPRRAGPKFPDYARMFLMALEYGNTRGLLRLGD